MDNYGYDHKLRGIRDASREAQGLFESACRVAGDGQHDPGLTPGPHPVTCTKCGDELPLDQPMPSDSHVDAFEGMADVEIRQECLRLRRMQARLEDELRSRGDQQRHGQWLWNNAMEAFPDATEAMRGTTADCFYDDQKVTWFLRALVAGASGDAVSKLKAIEEFGRSNPCASMAQLLDAFFAGGVTE